MAFQKITSIGFGGRLKNALGGTVFGVLMFIAGTMLLFWNEGNFVKTKKSIQEAGTALVSVRDVSSLDPALDGKLIHASAFADTQDTLTDGLFGVSEKAISLSRKVEYYQYKEHSRTETKDKIGGGQERVVTYTYTQEWVPDPVNSGSFEDPSYRSSNFVLTRLDDKREYAANVSFGGYKLPSFIISSIRGNVPADVKLTGQELQRWEDEVSKNMAALGLSRDTQMVHVQGNEVYLGKSPSNPAIGDVRVTLAKIVPADISIIAKVYGNTFETFTASNGRSFSSVAMGLVSADAMIEGAKSTNKVITWILRIIGIILVIVGLKGMFGILPALFKVLPFLGSIVDAGLGLVCFIGGASWSLLVISISWLLYRPLIGIPMVVIAVAGTVFLKLRGK